jgi:hypothetical protein
MVGLLWDDETAISYDLQRAHSADVWFLKMRAWFWGITSSVAALLLGNIMGVFDINIFGLLFDFIGSIIH